jgi:transcriptional regulator with XRE-family HTH domain
MIEEKDIREELERLLYRYQKQELAKKLGISRPTLNAYLKDSSEMSIKVLNKVMELVVDNGGC